MSRNVLRVTSVGDMTVTNRTDKTYYVVAQ